MIKSYIGPMFSGKSDSLIRIYNCIWNKELIRAFKPRKDSRDQAFIKSKNYDIAIPAIYIDDLQEIKDYVLKANVRTVFIDEAELLTGNVSELVDLSVLYDIDFYIAGLSMTSEQKPFGLMGDILSVSDEIEVISGFCQYCNRAAKYTYYELENKDDDVLIGDAGYVPLCPTCLKKMRLRLANNGR